MDYELAKQLIDAGFPKKTDGPDGFFVHAKGQFAAVANPPTLEELIEACGKPFRWTRNIPKSTGSLGGPPRRMIVGC
jgi:hypothetical protein